jgi:uncharacterized protein (TIGR02147 family)
MVENMDNMRDITSYSDYRQYLKDYVAYKKSLGYISNRWFAQKVGINSSSWLTVVLQGRKGISAKIANKISQVLKHSRAEAEYFEALVLFNQARITEERNLYYRQLLSLRKSLDIQKMDGEQYEFYATWYHSVVRSIIGMMDFRDEHAFVARNVNPPITEAQVVKSVALLDRLGLIKKNEDGFYRLSSSAISTGEEWKSVAVSGYQQETMKMGWEALDRFKSGKRDVSTLSLGISEQGMNAIKEEIRAFRKKIMQIAVDDEPADRVYQMNIQFFPMSEPLPEAKRMKK